MNNACITGLSPSGHCGAAAYCSEPRKCCAGCGLDCSIRCGWLNQEDAANEEE